MERKMNVCLEAIEYGIEAKNRESFLEWMYDFLRNKIKNGYIPGNDDPVLYVPCECGEGYDYKTAKDIPKESVKCIKCGSWIIRYGEKIIKCPKCHSQFLNHINDWYACRNCGWEGKIEK